MPTEETLSPTERALRELLAIQCSGMALYTDDGELQDATRLPVIDFLRDAPHDIARKLEERQGALTLTHQPGECHGNRTR